MTDTLVTRVPEIINLELYAGDGAAIRFTLKDSDGNPFPLNGVITSQIKNKRVDTSPVLSWTVHDEDFATGIVVLSLTGVQTESLIVEGKPFKGVWDLQYIETGAEPVTFVQGKVKIDADVTR